MKILKPQPLTPEAFAPFGDVVDCATHKDIKIINEGNTQRFHDMAAIDVTDEGGTTLVNVFRSTPLPMPHTIRIMERHPLSSQMFMALGNEPYLVVVAPAGEFDPEQMVCFIANSNQGVNYHKGTWHHYSLALNSVSDFLVVDRGGKEKNLNEEYLPESGEGAYQIQLEP